MKKYKGPLLLLCAAFIWGSSFIVMKNAVDFLTPALLITIRFVLASLFLCILFYKQIKQFPRSAMKYALLTGMCLLLAYYVQTWGLRYTTPGKNAFLTAVYCVIVPFLVWVVYKQKPDTYHFIAAVLCVMGVGLVSLNGNLKINIGDFLTLCGGLLYAVHILFVQKFSQNVDGKAFTAFQFIGGSVLAFVITVLSEDLSLIQQIKPSLFFQIFYLAFFATGIAMLCQTIGQKETSECQSSIILSLESVFGVLFSVLFYDEVLTLRMIIGFVLILLAVLTSETKLSFLKKKGVKS